MDGTVFDSLVEGGAAEFGVHQVIPAWTEALQMMSVGDKWRIVCPPGWPTVSRGRRGHRPNSALVFEIHLIAIKDLNPKARPPRVVVGCGCRRWAFAAACAFKSGAAGLHCPPALITLDASFNPFTVDSVVARRVVFNQKAGVGKTSITCNLAAIGAPWGLSHLVIDLDAGQYHALPGRGKSTPRRSRWRPGWPVQADSGFAQDAPES